MRNEGNHYNRVLIESIPDDFRRTFRDGFSIRKELDLACLPFLLEEFISLSATEFVIPDCSEVATSVDLLHPSLRDRVTLISGAKDEHWGILWNAIREEFNVNTITLDRPGIFITQAESSMDTELQSTLDTLFHFIVTFSRAVDYQAQARFDIPSFKSILSTVRNASRNQELRTILAALQGVLETYSTQKIDSLIVIPHAYDKQINLVYKLLEDEHYRKLSLEAHSLGIPAKLYRAKVGIRKLVRKLVTRPHYKAIVDLGVSAASVSTGLPIPDSDWAESLLSKEYLPPSITFDRAVAKAKQAWENSDHIPISPPKTVGEYLIAGKWVSPEY